MASCSEDAPEEPTPPTTVDADPIEAEPPEVPAELAAFYEQDLTWEACGGRYECTRVTVPLDYADPERASIEIAVKRRTADAEEPIGALFVNPGGPGASGIDLAESAAYMFSRDLMAAYDVVGFDPRGVGQSDAVACISDAELDERRAAIYDTETDEGWDDFVAAGEAFAAACAQNTGELLGYVDTESSARDLDILRHVLGQARLSYLGYSYGTQLGATYADLFPEHVGRLVLDGGVDPSLDSVELTRDQAEGFENAIRSYAQDCLAGPDCPLRGEVDDALGQIQELFERVTDQPLPTGSDRDLTLGLLISGVLVPLYEDALWPVLSSALSAAMNDDDGAQFLMLADLAAERESDGSYSGNLQFAYPAIQCLDYPVVQTTREQMEAEAARLEKLSPTFGSALAYGELGCLQWTQDATREPVERHAEGADPIVVIGTTGDPATPYQWSVALAEQLDSGVLLTYEGEGHGAYGRSNSCIVDAVDGYLLRGEVPADGTRC